MVDIVVTYLNERDKKWQEDFKYWKDKEIKEGKADSKNRQAFGIERTREWDTFKYWFRGVEKNCSWVNKVFLIVQNERHIPEWLDRNNPKLRIVYHDEYIPKELLPTFNAMPIGMYIANISDLSENYIISDDDFYFLNPIPEDRFFRYGKPVHKRNKIPYEKYKPNGTDKVFFEILNNNLEFEKRFSNFRIKYAFYHLPAARKKSFEKRILDRYKEDIKEHFIVSKFRHKENLCNYIFDDLLKLCSEAKISNPYQNCCYCTLKSDVDFEEYKNKDIVCFNDTEQLDDYKKTKEKFISFLESMFPDESSFEKGDDNNAL